MNNHWWRTRGIDQLMRTSNSQIVRGLAAGALAGVVTVTTLFRPVIAIAYSIDSGVAPKLDAVTGALMVLLALVSVVLSLRGGLEARTKRVAWVVLCALSIFALALSATAAIAGTSLLQLYASFAHSRL